MAKINNKDMLARVEAAQATQEMKNQAIVNIGIMAHNGELQPIPDWQGSLVGGYLSILGLDGQHLRSTARWREVNPQRALEARRAREAKTAKGNPYWVEEE